MSYFCLCTFDLNEHATREDYDHAYADLKAIGFEITVTGGSTVTLPNTTTAGEFLGSSAKALRDDLSAKVKTAFERRGLASEIFILVGGDWAWAHRTT